MTEKTAVESMIELQIECANNTAKIWEQAGYPPHNRPNTPRIPSEIMDKLLQDAAISHAQNKQAAARRKIQRSMFAASLAIEALASGCAVTTLESGQFHAKRSTLLTNTETDFSLSTSDGAKVTANSLKSTVDRESLNAIIGGIVGLKP